jgi:hypothetical protein
MRCKELRGFRGDYRRGKKSYRVAVGFPRRRALVLHFREGTRGNTVEGWSYLAPGWKLFDPGAHDGHVMLLATVLDAAVYSIIIFITFYGFVKLVDKLTQ